MQSRSANPKQTSVESGEPISKRQDPTIYNPVPVTKDQQDSSKSNPSNSLRADFELEDVEAPTGPVAEKTVMSKQEKSSNDTSQSASGLPSDSNKAQVERNVTGAQNGSNVANVAVVTRGSPKNCNSLEAIAHAKVPHDDPDFPYDFGNVIDALEPPPQKDGIGTTLEAAGTALIEAAEVGLIAVFEKVFGQSADEESTSSAPSREEDVISDPCGTTYTEEKPVEKASDASDTKPTDISVPSSAADEEVFDPSVPLGSLGVDHIEPDIDQSIPLGSLGVKHVKPYRWFHTTKPSLASTSDANPPNPLPINGLKQANQGTSNGLTLDTSFTTTPFNHKQYTSSDSKNSDMIVQSTPDQARLSSSDSDEGIQDPVVQKHISPILHDAEPSAIHPKQVDDTYAKMN